MQTARVRRSLGALVGIVVGAVGVFPVAAQQAETAAQPVVYVADVESIIHPVSAEFMIRTMDRADAAGAALVVFRLETPGGLVDSTRAIVTRMLAAKTPVVVFVGPSGARAASAGFILAIAADVAAMAPGTHLGAAHPVAGGGEQIDEVMSRKAAQDVAAYVRTLAAGRQRNVALAEEAVNDSRAFTETEALQASPPLIDLVVADVPDLLQKLDGRRVRRFDGAETTVRTAGAVLVPHEMSLRERVLSAIANPNIAYLLLSLGMLGLTIELWSPGAILPGVVGGLSLLLAFFALQLLPVNYVGLLLIMLGMLLLILEIKVTSFGMLTVGGAASLIFGSLILVDSDVPELQLSLRVVLPVVIGFVGIGVLLVRLALAAQRQPSVTGASGMIGRTGQAIGAIDPGTAGRVFAHGELWLAVADEPIPPGARVRITDMDGLTLTVRKA
jgi:membrane-bound serine protease (ClpP class)